MLLESLASAPHPITSSQPEIQNHATPIESYFFPISRILHCSMQEFCNSMNIYVNDPFKRGLVSEVLDITQTVHSGQLRKNGEATLEYHQLPVAREIMNLTNGDYEQVSAALLHDAIEDKPREFIWTMIQNYSRNMVNLIPLDKLTYPDLYLCGWYISILERVTGMPMSEHEANELMVLFDTIKDDKFTPTELEYRIAERELMLQNMSFTLIDKLISDRVGGIVQTMTKHPVGFYFTTTTTINEAREERDRQYATQLNNSRYRQESIRLKLMDMISNLASSVNDFPGTKDTEDYAFKVDKMLELLPPQGFDGLVRIIRKLLGKVNLSINARNAPRGGKIPHKKYFQTLHDKSQGNAYLH